MKIQLIIILLFLSVSMNAQIITGKVYEQYNESLLPIPGVNVYWLNTETGTITNKDGEFAIKRIDPSFKYLIISYTGYKKDTISIETQQKNIQIILRAGEELKGAEVIDRAASSHISRLDPITKIEITGTELLKAACCNLGESFETNASVDVQYSDAVTGAKQIQLLGLSGIYTQMMTENIPNLYGLAQAYGLSYIPGTWMKSISVSKGSASVLDGYSSLTGQINTQTKDPDDGDRVNINGLINTMLKYEGNIVARFKLSKSISTNIFLHAENNSHSEDLNKDGFLDNPMVTQINIFNKWKFMIHKSSMITFGVKGLYEDRKGGQTHYFHDINNPDFYNISVKTKRLEFILKGGHEFANNNFNIAIKSTAFYHNQESFFGLNKYNATQKSAYINTVFQGVFSDTTHAFATGISFAYDNYEEQVFINRIINSETPLSQGYKSLNDTTMLNEEIVPGVYFQYTLNKKNYPIIIAGIRGDYHNKYGFFVTPRLHIRYALREKNVFRASAGMGYKSPRIIMENTSILASSKQLYLLNDMDMEKAWNYGINYTRYFTLNNKEFVLNAEFYRSDFINQIVMDLDKDYRFVYFYNLDGKSFSNVFQIEATYSPFIGFDMVVAFRYQDVKVTEMSSGLNRKPMVNRYKGLVNLSYGTRLDKWHFDVTLQLNGDQRLSLPDYSIGGNTNIPDWANDLKDKSPAYIILNSQITRNFKHWSIYIGCENLTNYKQENPILGSDNPFSEYFDSSRVWGPISGIMGYLGFRFNF